MIFVDTSVFIAAARPKDGEHQAAVALLREVLKTGETLLTTDHVLDETLTYLKRTEGKAIAREAGLRILKTEKAQVEYGTPARTEAALELLGKIDGLSFCDALSVVVMKELGIRTICSFDADFDKIKGLQRVE